MATNRVKRSVTESSLEEQKDKEKLNRELQEVPEWGSIGFVQEIKYVPEEALVTTQAIREYLEHLWKQYKKAIRALKSQILDELCRNLGMHRKAATRLMCRRYPPRSLQGFRGGRAKKYSERAKVHLERLWRVMGYMGPVRMKAALGTWIRFDEHRDCDAEVRRELLSMSESSIRRFLQRARAALQRRANTGTRRGVKRFVAQVPVRNLGFTPIGAGYCEIDCVAHCGGSLSGQFAWTLNLTDIATGWTECEAVWAKDGFQIKKALERIERRLPFPIKALYADNGSEFMNEQVIEVFATKGRKTKLTIERGRPYHKNDQAYVEQKNYTHIRHLFGYGRIDWQQGVKHMNAIYRQEWRQLQNFFMPQQKLIHKERHGSKIKRKMSDARTPYERLQEILAETEVRSLRREYEKLNPFRCRQGQLAKLKRLNQHPKSNITSNEWGKMAL